MCIRDSYNISLYESHHTTKKDAPSGTAVSLANQIIQNTERKDSWVLSAKAESNEIPITYTREGDVKGMHEITYKSIIDQIVIKHEAFSRDGFALGAVFAAEYIAGKQGIFTMSDVLQLYPDK